MNANDLFNMGVTMMKVQATQIQPQPFCTICDKPINSFDYDPINGGEIQQCDSCPDSLNEKVIEKHWG